MYLDLRKLWQSYKETALTTRLYANSIFLMANSVAGAALGFAFWVLAARLYPAEAVGLGSAVLSAAGLLTFIATMGLGQGLIRYLPGARSNTATLVNSCFTLSSLTALVAALIFLAGIPLWSPALSFVRDDLRFGVTFVTFVISSTLFSLLGSIYVALRRAEYSLVQGSLMGLLKLALVVALAGLFGIFGILASWTLATVAAVALGVFLFLPRLQANYRPVLSLRRQVSNEMVHFSFANYISTGLWNTPGWVLPLIIVNYLGSQATAHFFIVWAMAGLLFAIPTAISSSLFAEGSHKDTCLPHDIKRSLKFIALLALPAAALLMGFGDKLLLVFGRQYSQEGTRLLWLLSPSVLPLSLNMLYMTVASVRKKMREVVVITAAIAVSTLGLSYILPPRLGILAPGAGWLAGQTLVALALLPRFIKILRHPSPIGGELVS